MLAPLRTALSFLTMLPVGTAGELPAATLARSMVYFPVAGYVVASLQIATGWLLMAAGGPSLVAAVFMVVCGAILTRGLHLDGVADILDGFGGSYDREKRLAIMKDSRVGPFGATGLALVLVAKIVVLAALLEKEMAVYLVPVLAAPVAARWAMAQLAYRSRYPRPTGTGHPFIGRLSTGELMLGACWLLPLLPGGWSAVGVIVVSQFPALWLRFKAHRLLGGVTGDVLGAACELGEVSGWLAGLLVLSLIG